MGQHRSLHLTKPQRNQLSKLVRSGSAPARIQRKARILLLCDRSGGQQRTDAQVAEALLCSSATVLHTRHRFMDDGLEAAIYDRPRPGRKPKLDGAGEARLVLLACSEPPRGQASWTLQLLADELVASGVVASYSSVAVHKRLKKMRSSRGA